MAIYHFCVKSVSRAKGSSAVSAAAYRAAQRLTDDRYGRDRDFSSKQGVVYSEIILPTGATERLSDRSTLWNVVEAREIRRDARLARDVEFAIPSELNTPQGIALAREFVTREFVAKGMIADLNVHWDKAADGSPRPHAHVLLSTRKVGPDGFGLKVPEWNKYRLLMEWRQSWAEHANVHLAELGIDARIDHRRLVAQGIPLEAQNKVGAAAARRKVRGQDAERVDTHRWIARENGNKIIAEPAIALKAITHAHATFTVRDLAQFSLRHSNGKDQFDAIMSTVLGSPELVALGKDGRDQERFTSGNMITVENQLGLSALTLVTRKRHAVADQHRNAALECAADRGCILSSEQRTGYDHIMGRCDLVSIVGSAGSGTSAMLGVARDAWEREGYSVRGASLSASAAERLEGGSGISSKTITSLEYQWRQSRELLSERDVLVFDEAGLAGTRQIEHTLSAVRAAGAKVVLISDPGHLRATEVGAPFRWLAEVHGAVEITERPRQRHTWQRGATQALARGRTGEAIDAYYEQGMVHGAATRAAARLALVECWYRDCGEFSNKSGIIFAQMNAEVRTLNTAARASLRDGGVLLADFDVKTESGERPFATGDRMIFLRNERGMGITSGTLGTIESVSPVEMTVRTDDGRRVAFNLSDYAHIDHGYAATLQRSQGLTVDEAYILATPGMDRHSTYVALSRHRDRAQLYFGYDDFADRRTLVRDLSSAPAAQIATNSQIDAAAARAFARRREFRFDDVAYDLPGNGCSPLADTELFVQPNGRTNLATERAPSAKRDPQRASDWLAGIDFGSRPAAVRLRARVAHLGQGFGHEERNREPTHDRDDERSSR